MTSPTAAVLREQALFAVWTTVSTYTRTAQGKSLPSPHPRLTCRSSGLSPTAGRADHGTGAGGGGGLARAAAVIIASTRHADVFETYLTQPHSITQIKCPSSLLVFTQPAGRLSSIPLSTDTGWVGNLKTKQRVSVDTLQAT